MWVIGSIDSNGAVTAGPSKEGRMHRKEEMRGKRWRWCVWSQEFCLLGPRTLDELNDPPEPMTPEEHFAVWDWLRKRSYTDDRSMPNEPEQDMLQIHMDEMHAALCEAHGKLNRAILIAAPDPMVSVERLARTLRHPQLLDPPSICPRCGKKAWERITPDDVEPQYQCMSCHWPNLNASKSLAGANLENQKA